MIIADRFVYIHLPKTGGTFVEAALEAALAGGSEVYLDTSRPADRFRLRVKNQHSRVCDIPELDRQKRILFTVRNPYDHYVSHYEFGWWKDHPGGPFDEQGMRALYPRFPDITFDEWLEANFDWDLLDKNYIGAESAARFRDADRGPLTYDYVRYMFRCPELIMANLDLYLEEGRYFNELSNLHFLRMENLNRDLYEFLVNIGYDRESMAFILNLGNIYPDGGRPRPHRSWQEYYNPELKKLVRGRERLIFAMFPDYDV